jgi:hypothetical protein|tara:strand:+ start:136 stop:438 length:303 start_codon:yes stop_codon:yes gene_type:complete
LINYVKNSTSDQEVIDVKEWLRSGHANTFRKYVMNDIAFHQAMAGKEASLNHKSDRGWEVNEHVKEASELIKFVRILNEYSKPEKELYRLTLEIDTNLED